MLPLFAFLAEIDRILDSTPDAAVAGARLHWWSEEVQRFEASAPRHPIMLELLSLRAPLGLDRTMLDRCILAAAAEIGGNAPADIEEWLAFQAAGPGQIWAAAARAAGAGTEPALELAARTGALHCALLRLLDAFRRPGGRAGRLPGLSGHGDPGHEPGALAGQLETAFRLLHRQLAESGRGELLFCRICARLSAELCLELRRDCAAHLGRQVALTPLRKLWIAWREQRRHRRSVSPRVPAP